MSTPFVWSKLSPSRELCGATPDQLATLSWVHWFNHDRLHSHCADAPPAEFEAAFYAAQQTDPTGVGIQ